MKKLFILALSVFFSSMSAQNAGYWQQQADYKMSVSMDVSTYRYSGKQEIIYKNNSKDTLRKVYYHLYPNAFRPGSEMDARLHSIKDPDGRMTEKKIIDGIEKKISRIAGLKPDEMGYLNIQNFRQDGKTSSAVANGTILEVTLAKALLPGKKTRFTLDFEGQVPIQIRRSGRNNSEGVELSMTQWYPKIAEYDFEGWHADPYIAREFFGVWGNYDVSVTIDSKYTLGGTGYLQNPDKIGHGYQSDRNSSPAVSSGTLTWHFKAPMVHDFAWAADRDYIHDIVQVPDGAVLHFLYKNNPKIIENWKNIQPLAVRVMQFYNKIMGSYPYKQYSVIQGGDGGMEYNMCTLMLGEGKLEGMLGTMTHEMAHAWFQGVLASNESKHGWMDEGFASYIETLALEHLAVEKKVNPFEPAYNSYVALVKSGKELPQSTHADRFDENKSYSTSSYRKGELFLSQLEYLIGKEHTARTLKRFYRDFKLKHPTPNDIRRTAERVSGAHLDWYLTDWTQTTNTIDYAVTGLVEKENLFVAKLQRLGRMPMPVEAKVMFTDGTEEYFYIPLRMMHYTKPNEVSGQTRTVLKDWAWASESYELEVPKNGRVIRSITLDPTERTADIDRSNNYVENK